MTATGIELWEYLESLRAAVPYVHPAGQVTINEWLSEMRDAVERGDVAEFARLAVMVAEKVDQELGWYSEDSGEPIEPTPIVTPQQSR
jgi:hypothetical protein